MSKTRVVNSGKREDLPLASDAECRARRHALLRAGIVGEGNSDLITRDDGSVAVSTKKFAASLRQQLIRDGLLDPNYIEIPPAPAGYYTTPINSDEGEYKVRPIENDAQYQRRRTLYLRSLQEILISRRELNLSLGPKKSSDPDWIF